MRQTIKMIKELLFIGRIYLLVDLVLSLGIPIYIGYVADSAGFMGLAAPLSVTISSFYMFFMFFGKTDLVEDKCKQMTYVLLTPVNRSHQVAAKYVLTTVMYGLSIVGYCVASIIVDTLPAVTIEAFAYSFLIYVIYTGIYLPLEKKLGFESMKVYPMGMLLVVTFVGAFLGKKLAVINAENLLEWIEKLSIAALAIGVVFILVSFIITRKIYENKEL